MLLERVMDSDEPRPLRSDSLQNRPPVQPWPEPVEGRVLLNEIRQTLKRFAVLPVWTPETLSLWDVHGGGGSVESRGSRLVRFWCWGREAIALIVHLPETLEDRCIVIEMQRKMATEECERLEQLDVETVMRVEGQCLGFVQDNAA